MTTVGRRNRSRALTAALAVTGLAYGQSEFRRGAAFLAGPPAPAGRSSSPASAALQQQPRAEQHVGVVTGAPADGAAAAASSAPLVAVAAALGLTARGTRALSSSSQSRRAGADNAAIAPEGSTTEEGLPDWLPRASLFLFALFCSTNFTLLKVLEEGRSEAAVAAARFGIAAIPFLPLVPKHSDWLSIKSGVEIGLWCAFAYICQAMGLPQTDASTGAFITSLAMVVVPVAKSLTGGEVKSQLWGAVVLALMGTALLVGVGGDGGGFNNGDLLCLCCAIGFGLMFFRMDAYSKQDNFDDVGCTIWQVLTLAVCMGGWMLATLGTDGSQAELASLAAGGPQILAILAWVGIVTTAGVLYVETWAMKKVDGTEAGIIFASEPVWATIFASVVLGESFGMHEAGGAACILMACLLTEVDVGAILGNADDKQEASQEATFGDAKAPWDFEAQRVLPGMCLVAVATLTFASRTGAF